MEKNEVVTGRRKRALRSAAEASARPELARPDSFGNRRPLLGQTEFSVTRTSEFHGDSSGSEGNDVGSKNRRSHGSSEDSPNG
ncbi:hypothetical protein FH972_009448 [Carpinus fangiana]|uniref:Uncharacterized protein n=1 Tax=Carpinus fangiana TaxID=176857 RepID=A0A5N6R4V7_9ROSI|nr:hypothetical protein FH972_009448 [Carpinus fangiana]